MTDQEQDDNAGIDMARRVMWMVAELHQRGYESLYLHCGMSSSGAHWRHRIGAMNEGHWPRPDRDPLQIHNSMSGGSDPRQIPWGALSGSPTELADAFEAAYPHIVQAARVPNPEHVAWFRHMLTKSEPDGLLVYYHDYKTDPRPEFWGSPSLGFLELPPGLETSPWFA